MHSVTPETCIRPLPTSESWMKTREVRGGRRGQRADLRDLDVPGIVIARGRTSRSAPPGEPKIAAFIWGWKIRPAPTLPFGRWKRGD